VTGVRALTWLFVLGLACVLSGCHAFDRIEEREIAEITITGDLALHEAFAPTDTDLIEPQTWEVDLPFELAGVFLESLTLSITEAGDADGADDFGFISQVVFYLEPTTSGSSLGRHMLAWVDDPGPVRSITLVPNRALNFVPYILEGFQVTSEVTARVPATDVTFDGRAVLSADVF